MLTLEEFKQNTVCTEHICSIHDTYMMQLNKAVLIRGENEPRKPAPFCPECLQEERNIRAQQYADESLNKQLYITTYRVLERDSTIPKELRGATFSNYIAETDEEHRLLDFAKGQAQKYLDGMVGNTLLSGGTGIGKSHLSLAMAKAINEGYKAKNEPKSVLFVTLTEIIKRLKEGWSYGKGATLTEHEAVKLLTEVDYLILDDLGAKNATPKAKSDWEQDFLFDILNNRETTIINTNLDSAELRTVYNDRNASRILKGLEGNTFKAFTIKDKRFGINKFKTKGDLQ